MEDINVTEYHDQYMFFYQIKIEYVGFEEEEGEECEVPEDPPAFSAQLETRTWVIKEGNLVSKIEN